MKLSEAIRLGAMLGPQLRDGQMLGPYQSSCALGAAALASGNFRYEGCLYELGANITKFLGDHFGLTNKLYVEITLQNDMLGKTREEIADWIVANDYDCESVESRTLQPSEEEVSICC